MIFAQSIFDSSILRHQTRDPEDCQLLALDPSGSDKSQRTRTRTLVEESLTREQEIDKGDHARSRTSRGPSLRPGTLIRELGQFSLVDSLSEA